MTKVKKERVDVLLVEQGLFESREQAKRSVMAGEVYDQNNQRLDKPGVKSRRCHFACERQKNAVCKSWWA